MQPIEAEKPYAFGLFPRAPKFNAPVSEVKIGGVVYLATDYSEVLSEYRSVVSPSSARTTWYTLWSRLMRSIVN